MTKTTKNTKMQNDLYELYDLADREDLDDLLKVSSQTIGHMVTYYINYRYTQYMTTIIFWQPILSVPRLFVAYYSPMLIELSPLSNQPLTSCYLLLVFDTFIFNDFFFTIVSGLTLSIIHANNWVFCLCENCVCCILTRFLKGVNNISEHCPNCNCAKTE